jgi:dihydrofolate reductase
MSKIILFNLITLDGYFEGPNHDISWHNVDHEFNEFAIQQLGEAGGLIFGRVTYALMSAYWPTPLALEDDPIVAEKMNTIPKIVFSRTMAEVTWSNTRLVKGDAAGEILKLRQQTGKPLFIFGSANLAASLIPAGLIDEIRLMVNPVVLGRGRSMFEGVKERLNLKLLNNRAFRNGNVLLYYQPEKMG